MRAMHLLYLHGFRSSPGSFKARHLQAWLAAHRPDVHWWCPQLPPSPAAAWTLICKGIKGWQTQFHRPDETFFFRPEYIAELQALRMPALTRLDRYGAVIAKGDEVLDWREMLGLLGAAPGATIRLLLGSDHAISDFDEHLPFILQFLHLQDDADQPTTERQT